MQLSFNDRVQLLDVHVSVLGVTLLFYYIYTFIPQILRFPFLDI